jgi:hypothetical protein
MRFLSVYTGPERTAPPTEEEIARMGEFIAKGKASGVLLSAAGCMPTAKGARIRIADGKFATTDGPFSEAKEVIGGFSLLEAPSKEAALDYVRGFLELVGQGQCELRQLFG